ncbi:TPA: amino acid permease [Candidatus Woesearchaeota archaeon]|nr:amino acid permease [Candidatus Woesearchaeota archaeon]HII68992.1 amino acid permease [Candidatus Woesearchaeota archaeon]
MGQLERVLSFPTLLVIVINSIMGTGIFFLPALGAAVAGPASLISWLILSIVSIYIAMCFGELASMFPKEGGVYEFSKQAFGRFPSFLVGWSLLVSSNLTISMLVIGAIQYLLPFDVPLIKIIIPIMFIIIFNAIAYSGMKTSATMLVTFSLITLSVFVTLIFASFLHFDAGYLEPFFVAPVPAVFFAIILIAETFFGWESSTFLAGETKDGEKVVPRAIVLGTVLIAVIALLFVLSTLGSMPWQEFGSAKAPLTAVAQEHFGDAAVPFFTIWVYLAIIGSVAVWAVSSPRLVLAMARDRLFLRQFAAIHPKYHTPHKAIVFQACASILLVIIGAGQYTTLLEMLLPLLLILYSITLIGLVVLRKKRPEVQRHYKVPFGSVGPLIVVAFFAFLLVVWFMQSPGAVQKFFLAVLLILLGIPFYILLQLYYNPKVISFVRNQFALLTLLTEWINVPPQVRKEAIHHLGRLKGETVLEYGCSVGTLTRHLAEAVGKHGKVFATDLSVRHALLAQRRMERKGHCHVRILYDAHHHKRIHPDVPKVDKVISVGVLGYVPNPVPVLKDINSRLKRHSRICFVDYDDFFDIIPNTEWLGNDALIKATFSEAGFTVDVARKQGFAWKYVFIYGVKFRDVK